MHPYVIESKNELEEEKNSKNKKKEKRKRNEKRNEKKKKKGKKRKKRKKKKEQNLQLIFEMGYHPKVFKTKKSIFFKRILFVWSAVQIFEFYKKIINK